MKIPYNTEAEQSLLGSLIGDNEMIPEIIDKIKAKDFYQSKHSKIYECIQTLYINGKGVDLVSVAGALQAQGELEKVGGNKYIGDLVTQTPAYANAKHYADIVKEMSMFRGIIKTCGTSMADAQGKGVPAVELYERTQQELLDIAQDITNDNTYSALQAMEINNIETNNLIKRGAVVPGIPTGFYYLDKMISGMSPGDLIILAARPSVGKSAMATNILYNVIKNSEKAVMLFSLEMSVKQVTDRIISGASGVPLMNIKTGVFDDEDYKEYVSATARLSEKNWSVNDSANVTVGQIRALATKQKILHGLDLIIVDYLQLLNGGEGHESRQQQITAISRSLKILAKDMKVPVLTLSQLSRACEIRGDKPILSDLRESGAIEQDADMVLFLHQPKVKAGGLKKTELWVSKNRNGPTGMCNLGWTAKTTTFVEVGREF